MKNFRLLLTVVLSLLSFRAQTGPYLVMQCEVTDFFEDIKISGAIGFNSQHPLMKKIYADTTLIGLLYHPTVGLHCGALPLEGAKEKSKRGIARGISVVWPMILNGIRDTVINNHKKFKERLVVRVSNTEKKDYSDLVAITDTVLKNYTEDTDLIQEIYDRLKESVSLVKDTKQKELLENQINRIMPYLGNNERKGLS